jgi:hypothetical protein
MTEPRTDLASISPDLIAPLGDLVVAEGLDAGKLAIAIETDGRGHIRVVDKHTVAVSDGKKAVGWPVPSLAELFRGDRLPPPDIDHYPPDFGPLFFFIETQFLTLCDLIGDRTDQEMEEVYSALRRRPDGRSVSATHDFIWQVVALLLGRYPLSAAEFEGIVGALLRSTRKWGLRPVSRYYVAYLRDTFGRV